MIVQALAQPGADRTTNDTRCAHCGDAVADGRALFCCAGCSAAYGLINGMGFGDYYRRRTLDAQRRPPRPDQIQAIDLTPHVRAASSAESELELALDGLQCAACVWLIETVLGREPDVVKARVNMTLGRLTLRWIGTPERAVPLVALVSSLGYRAAPLSCLVAEPDGDPVERGLLRAMAVAGFGSMNVMMLSVGIWAGSDMGDATRALLHWASALITVPTVFYAGQPFFRSALGALRHGRTNMDVPISIGVTLATALSLYETLTGGHTAYFESAAMLLFFLLIGRYLDHRARSRARAAIDRMLSLHTGTVTVVGKDGAAASRLPSEVRIGDTVLVAAGERVGVDGVVATGESAVDASLVTGEAQPQSVQRGAQVFAGMVNLGNPFTIAVTAAGEETLLAEIVRLLAAAEQGRARFVALADRVARLYAPVIHVVALTTFLGWLLWLGRDAHTALLVAVSVLIITCPCALALAVPAVQIVANGHLLRRRVLLKSPTALERLRDIDTVVFDKTGTLTVGRPTLLSPEAYNSAVLRRAGRLAAASRHPLAQALAASAGNPAPADDALEEPGSGIAAMNSRLGNRTFCGIPGAPDDAASELWFIEPDQPPVRFQFADPIRADARKIVEWLRRDGLEVQLLSGDHAAAVGAVARAAGIETWIARVTPAEKVSHIEDLARSGRRVLMVGDGLNDAAALAAAHASLAPATGADVTQAAADAVFQGDRLAPVATALLCARRADRLVRENLAIALIYNLLAVPLAVAGMVTPLIAAAAMSGSSIIVVANAMRAARMREPK